MRSSSRGSAPVAMSSTPTTGEVLVKKGRIFTQRAIKQMRAANMETIPIAPDELLSKVFAVSIADPKTGELLCHPNEEISEEVLAKLKSAGINEFEILHIDAVSSSDSDPKDAGTGQGVQ
jgi:DNA-directed RNA polymerase subunit beta